MGRGDRSVQRWKNDRSRKKKAREKRQAQERHEARTGAPTTSS